MATGREGEVWLREYEDVKAAAEEALATALQHRATSAAGPSVQDGPSRGGGGSARTAAAAARRKLTLLLARADTLRRDAGQDRTLSERERSRRQDLAQTLHAAVARAQGAIAQPAGDKSALLAGADGAAANGKARETDRTADLDSSGILQLQTQLMRDQDEELEGLSKLVTSSKHIALTINEELDLHTHLLDDLDDDVDHTRRNIKRAQGRMNKLFKKGGSTCAYFMVLLLVVVLLIVVLAIFKARMLYSVGHVDSCGSGV
eukprot:jgi/Chlat1/4733/Chrsp30S04753